MGAVAAMVCYSLLLTVLAGSVSGTDFGAPTCKTIMFNVSSDMDCRADPWHLADVKAGEPYVVSANVTVFPADARNWWSDYNAILNRKEGYIMVKAGSQSSSGRRSLCDADGLVMTHTALSQSFSGVRVGRDCANLGKLVLWTEYHADWPPEGRGDSIFPIGFTADVCWRRELPPLCSQGFPTGDGVLHECNAARVGHHCAARCNSTTHQSASRVYRCNSDGWILPVTTDVVCVQLEIPTSGPSTVGTSVPSVGTGMPCVGASAGSSPSATTAPTTAVTTSAVVTTAPTAAATGATASPTSAAVAVAGPPTAVSADPSAIILVAPSAVTNVQAPCERPSISAASATFLIMPLPIVAAVLAAAMCTSMRSRMNVHLLCTCWQSDISCVNL